MSEEAVVKRIKEESGFKTYEKAKLAYFSTVDTSVLNAEYNIPEGAELNKTVIKLGGMKYSQLDLAEFVQLSQRKQANIDKDVYLEKLFNRFADEKCLEYEDAHLEEKYPEFRALMQEYHDGILLFNLTDEKVWSKAVKDTTGLEAYFNANQEKYQWGERVDATIFQVKDKNDLATVRTLITAHTSDGDIAKALDQDSITSVTIIPGIFEKGDNKAVDQVNWVSGTTSEVSSDVEKMVTIVRIREVLPPGPKELDEARGIATADYQTYLEQEWVKQLKEKYPVVINEEILQQLLAKQ
jgi:peptidyl-prolyl cis-trans isomerase SurA